jgi:hypothetical protein
LAFPLCSLEATKQIRLDGAERPWHKEVSMEIRLVTYKVEKLGDKI